MPNTVLLSNKKYVEIDRDGDTVEKISLKQFDEVYQLFEQSFIQTELRPYQKMKDLFQRGLFSIYAKYEKDELLGAMVVWELNSCIYLENFAVNEKQRGQGLGSYFLKQFCHLYDGQLLVLEVEKPHDDLSNRRIGFYERMGFLLTPFGYVQPTFRSNDEAVSLILMTYPEMIDHQKYQEIKEKIFKVVYQQKGEL